MSSQRNTIRIPQLLGKRLKKHAGMKGRPESEVVREALESYLGQSPTPGSAYDLARDAGLIGCVRGAPRDLSTHRKHFDGFGDDR
jgi:predicted DNA-binding protein